jgi:hypothetical protein
MFVREKRIGHYTYIYLVETVREEGRTKQRIIRNLGRKEDVERRGDLDRLVRSAARLARRSMILSLIDAASAPALTCKRIGPPLLFERLWRGTGCGEVLQALLADRGFEFSVERAVFLTVLHRLMLSGSDRACGCSRGGDPCSPIWRWCSWIPPRCISRARAVPRSASAATPRITARS